MRLSTYSFLFQKNNSYFVFNTRHISFFEISKDDYDLLKGNRPFNPSCDEDFVRDLRHKGILCSENEDHEFFNLLETRHFIGSFSTRHLSLTICPTIQCNLRCPYCFETDKPIGRITEETINKIIDFIKSHIVCKTISITWFGGEPLLCKDEIKLFLDKIKSLQGIKLTYHNIITNGTLLDDDAIDLFKLTPLNSIQITLDGQKNNHDKKRKYPSGAGSFDKIIYNTIKFANIFPSTNINLRVNIDKSNHKDYNILKDYIRSISPNNNNIFISPAILRKYQECGLDDFFDENNMSEFYSDIQTDTYDFSILPSHSKKGCTATSLGSYIIGPKGELYHCLEDVGQSDKCYGNIGLRDFTNSATMISYLKYGIAFSDPTCKKCVLLPICTGGCPKHRLENMHNSRKRNLCDHIRDDDYKLLKEWLYSFYCDKTKTQQ